MHLFLQGEKRIGKSSMLLKILAKHSSMVTGTITQRLIQNGKTIGYRSVIIEDPFLPLETPYTDKMNGVFLINGNMNISVLEKTIAKIKANSQKPTSKLILLDEIGGIELTSTSFMENLYDILSCGKPCIGVMKSKDNLSHTSNMLNLEGRYMQLHQNLENIITSNGQLFTMTNENKEIIYYKIEKFIYEIFKN